MRARRIYLVNPKADSAITRPLYFGRALYSPLAGLLAVAALIPQDRYEVVLTDENVEPVDFDLTADLVGISAMTSYVKRGYEIADAFRRRGIPVIMGGVHPSFMPDEALQHADAVLIGEAELVMHKVLDDLDGDGVKGIYKADRLHSMQDMPLARYDLIKPKRYVNRTFIQTSRGCHHACTFCAEQLMYGLRFRYRPVDEVMREIDATGARSFAFNDADFFGTPARAAEVMQALKGRRVSWQAGVNFGAAFDDRLLELAAASGCNMLAIGFESLSRETLRKAHKYQNSPERYRALVEKLHSHGILVFGLFMFGFDQDEASVFDETARFVIDAGYDVCGFSIMTPYPGTLNWFEMLQNDRIASFDWNAYDQHHVVYKPVGLGAEQLRDGQWLAYDRFYGPRSLLRRFPLGGGRSRALWSVYNLFYRRMEISERDPHGAIAAPGLAPIHTARPPLMPQRADWRALILGGEEAAAAGPCDVSEPV
ncbi:MAG: B12-binding domain-containing radical SAM protein [Rhodospirillales bacterium]|nr:B12-binding domain-containing radical SAM protein [Rhodospirillales bacterium]